MMTVLRREIEIAEIGMPLLSLGYGVWFVLFDVANSAKALSPLTVLPREIWATIFLLLAIFHIVGFVMNAYLFRLWAAFLMTAIVFSWTFVVAYGNLASTAAPTLFVFSVIFFLAYLRLRAVDKKSGQL